MGVHAAVIYYVDVNGAHHWKRAQNAARYRAHRIKSAKLAKLIYVASAKHNVKDAN